MRERTYDLGGLATRGVRKSEFGDDDGELGELVVRLLDVCLEIGEAVAIPVLWE